MRKAKVRSRAKTGSGGGSGGLRLVVRADAGQVGEAQNAGEGEVDQDGDG